MKIFICDRFSLSMLDRNAQYGTPPEYKPISGDNPEETARLPRPVDDPRTLLQICVDDGVEIVSAVGDKDVARIMSAALGRKVDANKIDIRLGRGSLALVGQCSLKGAKIEWWLI